MSRPSKRKRFFAFLRKAAGLRGGRWLPGLEGGASEEEKGRAVGLHGMRFSFAAEAGEGAQGGKEEAEATEPDLGLAEGPSWDEGCIRGGESKEGET